MPYKYGAMFILQPEWNGIMLQKLLSKNGIGILAQVFGANYLTSK